ncbi:branched-chain amino acid ABC transporter substrate-binding protein [Nakamurella panacisegetis]|nr:branched-chain amino acid ABC transporter substrate-binding protein [Nakamurella panacisegetis]
MALAACSNSSTASSSSSAAPAASPGAPASSAAPAASSGSASASSAPSSAAAGGGLGGGGTTIKIAFQGPLSGDNQQLGINEVNGFRLAISEANASGKLGFTLAGIESDDQGAPDKAPAAAAKILQDSAVVGVIGPSFSGATKAVGKTYGDAGLAMITPSATNPTLSTLGFTTFHRIVPSDNVEGTQGADWLATKGIKTVYVIDDLSDYGKGVADAMEKELTAKGVKVTRQGVDAKTTDYTASAQAVQSSGAGALFYGGYDAQAALFAKALKAAGYKGLTVTGNGGKSSVFTTGAGAAGNGWYFTCGCLDATTAPAAKAFTAAYTKMFNTPPSTYSPEAYDATNALIEAIKAAKGAGSITKASVETAVNALDYKGITTEVKFEKSGEVSASVQTVNLYQQKNGAIVLLGNIKDQK